MKNYYVVERGTLRVMDRLQVKRKTEATKQFNRSFGKRKYFLVVEC